MHEPTTNLTFEQEQHRESHASMYLKVWGVLLIFTLMEYFYAAFMHARFLTLVIGLMIMACIKAGLVGWYFMHLKFEGRWVYSMIIPAMILMCVLLFGLYPDIGMRPIDLPAGGVEEGEEAAIQAPAVPGPGTALRG